MDVALTIPGTIPAVRGNGQTIASMARFLRHIHSTGVAPILWTPTSVVTSSPSPALIGDLKDVRPDDLAGQVAFDLLNRTGVNPDDLDDVMVGCAYPEGEQGSILDELSRTTSKASKPSG